MNDLRERVARAICAAEMGHDLLDQMVNTRENYFDAADAAIAAVFQWQPIETAPKPKKSKDPVAPILIAYKAGNGRRIVVCEARWRDLDRRWETAYSWIAEGSSDLVAWMPLPPPPGGAE